jgi:sporulation protein YlmC with PRC-barrel domain
VEKSVRSLLHKPVAASNGGMAGTLADVYFDDRDWRLRYLVLDPGNPMPRREVLVPAIAILRLEPAPGLSLTHSQVEHCPPLDDDPPVYLQHELGVVAPHGDPHLRSCEVLLGYAVCGADRQHGRLVDLMLDGERRAVVALVVETGSWLGSRRFALPPSEVRRIDWVLQRLDLRTA